MLFNSLPSSSFFLPIALLGYYALGLVGHRWAAVWLVVASFVFYAWWTANLIFLLAASIAFNFTCGALILRAKDSERTQSWLLAASILANLSLLVYYKYFFSLLNWLGFHGIIHLSQSYDVILPLGISFFTFTQIGYLVDCKGGVVQSNKLLDYCLFVTFFPHLIAGPILHHREMMPQFADPTTYRPQWRNMAVGSALFTIGLAKKILLADSFIDGVAKAFSHPDHLSLPYAWVGAFSYSLQLYFDFSGYSDMACGLALLLRPEVPANFNSPYRAASIIEFWQRWHMTLTRYLTLYLYNPVALWISRRRLAQGKSVSRKAISTVEGFVSMIAFPTFYTMALAGVWHGAGLTFLLFGLLHASYLTINHAWRSFGPRVPDREPHPVLRSVTIVAKIGLTYAAVVAAQAVFRSESLPAALRYLGSMAGLYGFHPEPGQISMGKLAFLAFSLGIVWFLPNSLQLLGRYQPTLTDIRPDAPLQFQARANIVWGIVIGLILLFAMLAITGTTEFIYFRF